MTRKGVHATMVAMVMGTACLMTLAVAEAPNQHHQFRIAIPPDATNLVIGFSAMQGIAGAPVRRKETSGTVTDQDPPNRKIFIQLSLKPATQ